MSFRNPGTCGEEQGSIIGFAENHDNANPDTLKYTA